jgi:predicted small lipoprotein YifL
MSGAARALTGRAPLICALLAAFGALGACGQRGPLTLPGAEPTERGESPAAPSGAPEAPGPTEPAPEDEDESIQNER